MAAHRFTPTRFYNAIGRAEPVLRIADGDGVVTTTLDACGVDDKGEAAPGSPESDDRTILR